MRAGFVVPVAIAVGCAGGSDGGEPTIEVRAHAIADRADVVSLHRDVALVCDEAPLHGDSGDAIPDCDAAIVRGGGEIETIGRGGVIAAARFGADSMMLLTRAHDLVLRDRAGREIRIASAVADPRVADGGRVTYAELPAGATEYRPGTPVRLVVRDLARGTRRVVSDGPWDSSPFAVPGGDDVIFVSARTGVASIWLSSPGRPPRQITNVGLRRVGPGFVPPPSRDLVWIPGTRRAVYSVSSGGGHEMWSVDLDGGDAAPAGAGRFPVVEVTP